MIHRKAEKDQQSGKTLISQKYLLWRIQVASQGI